mmetsp:Transcript_3297/g.9552  ORF Transcript_3297/g.9552 Transcript_3297/m.9552 type:complete len:258 (-) Transcript_3297:655-1428(-)
MAFIGAQCGASPHPSHRKPRGSKLGAGPEGACVRDPQHVVLAHRQYAAAKGANGSGTDLGLRGMERRNLVGEPPAPAVPEPQAAVVVPAGDEGSVQGHRQRSTGAGAHEGARRYAPRQVPRLEAAVSAGADAAVGLHGAALHRQDLAIVASHGVSHAACSGVPHTYGFVIAGAQHPPAITCPADIVHTLQHSMEGDDLAAVAVPDADGFVGAGSGEAPPAALPSAPEGLPTVPRHRLLHPRRHHRQHGADDGCLLLN